MFGDSIRVDLAAWAQTPGTEKFNSGLFDWSGLDEQDRRTRRRYGLDLAVGSPPDSP